MTTPAVRGVAFAAVLMCGCGFFSASPAPAPATPAKGAGAGSAASAASPANAATPAPLQVHVQADAKSNLGGPLYVVVRKTDAGRFLAEDYAHVAGDVFPNNPDAVLATAVLWPDKDASIVVPRTDPKQAIGVYFLFASPEDGKWRLLVGDPCTTRLDVVLGPASILSYEHAGSC